ncbi:MAG: NADH-quinone oxidoreductase subunit N [candidate division Zixibacteria bacterium]|nr:NADH-quinone oxidoreductase subunit N [candidate division Zixibacteria bacterium]MDH3937426.1 NADH-quinone oxidoreductase subunit N [candidate division Zixibacteria bacterium]MDH4034566.1 NADH-quinone oxidoreductase subunit N [candidate division Zixibacteria bacterium]
MDFTSASINFELIYSEIALLSAAFLILVTSAQRHIARLAPLVALLGMAVSMFYAVQQWGNQMSGFFGMVTCDDFGTAFKILFLIVAMLVLLIAHRYLSVKRISNPEFYALLLISTMGMMVMANTTDLLVMFLGLEIMSVPLYVMAGLARRSLESNEAGIKYFIMGAFASAFLLLGIAFVFGASGTTDLRRIVADFSFIVSNFSYYLYVGAGLILIGFGFKVAAVPFHSWVPDVYQGAPTPVTAFFSVGPKAAGFAVMLRIFLYGFAQMDLLSDLFWILAVLTMTVGNILALKQDNVKRMLACSSIAHAGYILVALCVGSSDALAAALFYLVGYAMFNLGAFAVVTLLETRSGCKSDFTELNGMASSAPYLSAVLALFMFALSGFPPTVGFFGKFYVFSTAVKSGYILLTVIGVMNSFLSVYYYLRVIKTSYFDKLEGTFAPVTYSPAIMLVLVITVVGTLGLGFFPDQVLKLSQSALFAFL